MSILLKNSKMDDLTFYIRLIVITPIIMVRYRIILIIL